MRTALVIPSLGARQLASCLEAVAALEPAPAPCILVLSGGAAAPAGAPGGLERIERPQRLGFAAAVNVGIGAVDGRAEAVALLNDDAVPAPGWLGALAAALDAEPGLAAVQGTVSDATGTRVDGRGIAFDRWCLPIQIDRGAALTAAAAPTTPVAVSGTACLYRLEALRRAALPDGSVFDPSFGSYHEDLDLGLRLRRLGWGCACVGGAGARHLGSATGPSLAWRHPWWLLANRWRALAGNLEPAALLAAMPRLLRGELRAVRTLLRTNPRALPTAAAVAASLPLLLAGGWHRRSPGPRLAALPGPAR